MKRAVSRGSERVQTAGSESVKALHPDGLLRAPFTGVGAVL